MTQALVSLALTQARGLARDSIGEACRVLIGIGYTLPEASRFVLGYLRSVRPV